MERKRMAKFPVLARRIRVWRCLEDLLLSDEHETEKSDGDEPRGGQIE